MSSDRRRTVLLAPEIDAVLARHAAAHHVTLGSLLRRAVAHYVAILAEAEARVTRAATRRTRSEPRPDGDADAR